MLGGRQIHNALHDRALSHPARIEMRRPPYPLVALVLLSEAANGKLVGDAVVAGITGSDALEILPRQHTLESTKRNLSSSLVMARVGGASSRTG